MFEERGAMESQIAKKTVASNAIRRFESGPAMVMSRSSRLRVLEQLSLLHEKSPIEFPATYVTQVWEEMCDE